ncbi:hypothetical protein [Gemmobacter serpentinus]|uniref:hypothetical protein n=1 Tax=Gemmobacter serpentinus TaxID=2652247 RepID=UPI00124DB2E9|nr:hypothetical protein [Gemmobacter serpentinus]
MIRAASLALIAGFVAVPLRAEVSPTAQTAQAIALCWNTGGLSQAAQARAVTVGFQVDYENRPLPESVMLIGLSDPVADEAFAAARRAILRCSAEGLPLSHDFGSGPIEIVFDPGTGPQ